MLRPAGSHPPVNTVRERWIMGVRLLLGSSWFQKTCGYFGKSVRNTFFRVKGSLFAFPENISKVFGEREGEREREGGRERGREGARERGSEGARERGSEGARDGERRRERGRERDVMRVGMPARPSYPSRRAQRSAADEPMVWIAVIDN